MSLLRVFVGPSDRWATIVMMSVLFGFPERASAQFTLKAVQTKAPPVIDGVLADGEWNGASLATGVRAVRTPARRPLAVSGLTCSFSTTRSTCM